MKHNILYSVVYDLNKRRERTQVKFYDNHIFIHNLRLHDNYRRWYQRAGHRDTWYLALFRCYTWNMHRIYDLHLNTDSFRHFFQHKMEVCHIGVRFQESHMQEYIARCTETTVFSMNHYTDTFLTRLLGLWNRSCRKGLLWNCLLVFRPGHQYIWDCNQHKLARDEDHM